MTAETSNARGEVVAWMCISADGLRSATDNPNARDNYAKAGRTIRPLTYADTTPPPPAAARGDVRGLVAKWRMESEKMQLHPAGLAARRVCAVELEAALAAEGVQPEARGVVDEEVTFNAAFFVSRTGNRIEQLTNYDDYRRDGAVLALMALGQKRASARGLTKKNAGKVTLAWVTAPQIVECDHALTEARNG